MKAIITGLPELVGENQQMLGHLILMTMHANNFKVDDVYVEFQPDEGTPITPPAPLTKQRNRQDFCNTCGQLIEEITDIVRDDVGKTIRKDDHWEHVSDDPRTNDHRPTRYDQATGKVIDL